VDAGWAQSRRTYRSRGLFPPGGTGRPRCPGRYNSNAPGLTPPGEADRPEAATWVAKADSPGLKLFRCGRGESRADDFWGALIAAVREGPWASVKLMVRFSTRVFRWVTRWCVSELSMTRGLLGFFESLLNLRRQTFSPGYVCSFVREFEDPGATRRERLGPARPFVSAGACPLCAEFT